MRRQAVEAILHLEDGGGSLKLDRNPEKIAVLVRFLGERQGKLRFELISRSQTKLAKLPRFYFGRRDERGSIVDNREFDPELESPIDLFSQGWTSGSAFVSIPAASLSPGFWLMDAEGRVEPGKRLWSTERLAFTIPDRINTARP